MKRLAKLLAGLALGGLTAFVELGYLVVAGLVLLPVAMFVSPRRKVLAAFRPGARRLAELEHRRIAYFFDDRPADHADTNRAFRYLAVRWLVGLLGGLVLLLLVLGVTVAVTMLLAWLFDFPWSFVESEGRVGTSTILWALLPGIVLLFIEVTGIIGVVELDKRLAQSFLMPSTHEQYERRISELAASRAAVVDAVNDERRRIERDLHDGVQQRLVALGMLIGRARRSRSSEQAAALLSQAHDESQLALDELRNVAWRIYPAALDDGGLPAALETVAERSSLPVLLSYQEPWLYEEKRPLGRSVEAVAYFVVSEAVTNAAKHSSASRVQVEVSLSEPSSEGGAAVDRRLVVKVTDDGDGGADINGSGLAGLARRVAALDGCFDVTSPLGGPTIIEVELPCE